MYWQQPLPTTAIWFGPLVFVWESHCVSTHGTPCPPTSVAGRSPNVASLGLPSAGVEQSARGHITVDEWQVRERP